MPRPTAWLLIAFLLVWHAFAVGGALREAQKSDHGRDYATYHYAAQVALDGGDPYSKRALGRAAQADGTRRSVFPFLYPPSFLLLAAPFSFLSLKAAYLLWFGLGEVALAGLATALSRWWGRHDPAVTVIVVGALAVTTLVPDNLLMGQANLPVLALAVGGLALAEGRDGRRGLLGELGGGVLVGAAIALKLSPALLVGWWILRLRWRPRCQRRRCSARPRSTAAAPRAATCAIPPAPARRPAAPRSASTTTTPSMRCRNLSTRGSLHARRRSGGATPRPRSARRGWL